MAENAGYRGVMTEAPPGSEVARELLTGSPEGSAARGRHARFYLELAETAEPALYGPDHPAWLDRIEREHDNLDDVKSVARGHRLRPGGAVLPHDGVRAPRGALVAARQDPPQGAFRRHYVRVDPWGPHPARRRQVDTRPL